jgi:proteic killer suppression protein
MKLRALQALKGQTKANENWRICFVWRDNEAHDVEILDYH